MISCRSQTFPLHLHCSRVLHRVELHERLHDDLLEDEQGEDENPLDGCLHVFLDLGSNRGVQIRKLYEPHVFPLAPVQPLYQRFFGRPEERNLQEICSVRNYVNRRTDWLGLYSYFPFLFLKRECSNITGGYFVLHSSTP